MLFINDQHIRKFLKLFLPPLTLVLAIMSAGIADRRYIIILILMSVLVIMIFASGIENKNFSERRLAAAAVMTSLSVVGRFIPVFKPVTAIAIISGIYLGSETGFMVGAMSALISNFYFGQGPWTPFQMSAWGIIGSIAGIFSNPLQKSRILLLLYGIISGVVFSFIMDIWSVLWLNGDFDITLYKAALVTALPYTITYCISNAGFLMIFAKPFSQKLNRIKYRV